MEFIFDKSDMTTLEQAQEHCWLLANGLGGYVSTSAAFSVTRCDQGILIGAIEAPNCRMTLVHRLSERLIVGEQAGFLSTQTFGDGSRPEDGFRHLSGFSFDVWPEWTYAYGGVQVRRRCGMAHGANVTAVLYDIENHGDAPCTLQVSPFFLFCSKGGSLRVKQVLDYRKDHVVCSGQAVYIRTNGQLTEIPANWETLAYPDDEKDGRPGTGYAGSCCMAEITAASGELVRLELIFSTEPVEISGKTIFAEMERRQKSLLEAAGLRGPVARRLVQSADAFITRRDSTSGQTIIAGYPLFGDWGRDTMIAIPGCTLATKQYETARRILRTFLAYEKDGLVPNLFPEGNAEPRYNTADAALLLINCVWLYYQRTRDADFVREAWPVMVRIVEAYRHGTHHAIGMDADGLIRAGEGLDQVTWMDVCVDGILPTPRHGKPVEINAYWYNALRILGELAPMAGKEGDAYVSLAAQVKKSFVAVFWMEKKGCLKDVISGTKADEQIRCNQIWAVSMPFTMLSPEKEVQVVETVRRHLYTPLGLRTLSLEDPEFHPFYGGSRWERDMAYHQGTVWPYPLGAYYLAYLKVYGNTPEAARQVRRQLESMEIALREGCVGQLPEIYDGECPGPSKGCFAQAWSVGELLRVYEVLENLEIVEVPLEEDIHAKTSI